MEILNWKQNNITKQSSTIALQIAYKSFSLFVTVSGTAGLCLHQKQFVNTSMLFLTHLFELM